MKTVTIHDAKTNLSKYTCHRQQQKKIVYYQTMEFGKRQESISIRAISAAGRILKGQKSQKEGPPEDKLASQQRDSQKRTSDIQLETEKRMVEEQREIENQWKRLQTQQRMREARWNQCQERLRLR